MSGRKNLWLNVPIPVREQTELYRLPLPPQYRAVSTDVSDLSDLVIIQIVGHGSGGNVYKVQHRKTSALYALKIIRLNHNETLRKQIIREMEILRKTESPYIVKSHGIFEKGGEIHFVLEYMDGGSLEKRRSDMMSERFLAEVARQVLEGLKYLHRHKIVHRDIKPSNLLINSKQEVKIADFGVSRILSKTLDPCNTYVGTCAYMSPERFDSEAYGGCYDGCAGDIWSLGLSLLECFTGHFPFLADGQKADLPTLMCAICYGDPPSPPPTASAHFRNFITCCLQKDARKRWTAAQLLGHAFLVANSSQTLAMPMQRLSISSNLTQPKLLCTDHEAMKNNGGECKIGGNNDENVVDYERAGKEQIAKSQEYMSSLGWENKETFSSKEREQNQKTSKGTLLPSHALAQENVDCIENYERKQKASKNTLLPARGSLRFGTGLVHGEDADNTNDHHPNISHNDDHAQANIAEGLVFSETELGLRELFYKLKQRFEGPSEQIGEISSTTPNVANKEPIRPSTAKGKTPPLCTNKSALSTLQSLDSSEDMLASIQKHKMIQGMYRSTERKAKERKSEGKKPYLLEVKDGEPFGPNAARWASELGTKVRSHLDVTKSNFVDQDERSVDLVIRQMENAFETYGGRITTKYYKIRMRKLINNFRRKCRKSILDGKERDSSLTPKQWEELKESLCAEEYLQISEKGKMARDNVRDQFIMGRGGWRSNQYIFVIYCFFAQYIMYAIFVQDPIRSEIDTSEMVGQHLICDIDNSKHKLISEKPTKGSLPSNEADKSQLVNISTTVQSDSDQNYKHVMDCINGLTKTMSTIATSIEPIVKSWNKMGCHSDADEDKIKQSTDIDALQQNYQSVCATPAGQDSSKIDSACLVTPAETELFHVGDGVNILDPYDGAIAGTG